MGRGVEMFNIDIQRFKTSLRARGLDMKSASLEMGFSESYLHKATHRGVISKTGAILLERCYNIKPEEYALTGAKESATEAANYDEMYKVVYDATYKAMKMALKETLYENVKAAVRDGWMSV